ncbi:hypothetical protein Acr_02g0010820 [Actinidia rufa]|uniref:Uncharacterized protein n=1 Tax=Actinidia rufa TaxID=165716 RepID=A0A7J0E966_9ERIC|nr:hypothetical protein Acr_02g0010820 [Actinidia rufa]
MAHSLTPLPAIAPPISTTSKKKTLVPSLGFQRIWACHQAPDQALDHRIVHRRSVTLGFVGAVVGLSIGNRKASAAARRPPPPPAGEKKDPNVSGLQAKVLASKKRKEAMKEAVAKLRERGKPVDGPSE